MGNSFSGLGKILIGFGGVLILIGLLLLLGNKIPGLGRLPGDFVFKKGNLTVYLPLGTCILLSLLLTLICALLSRS